MTSPSASCGKPSSSRRRWVRRISEFRDRLILTRALDAKGRSREAGVELAAVERLMAQLSLGPEWLRILAAIQARRGDVGQARRVVGLMTKTSGAATADSTTNRNIAQDEAYVAQGRGELALAEGRAADAVGILEGARVGASADAQIIDALAAAQAAAGNLDAAATGYQEVIASRALGFEAQEYWLQAHLRLGEVYERLGRPADAREQYARLIALWKDGDADLLALREARARLSKVK